MLDDKFTTSIQTWLNAKAEDRDLRAGADLLLRLNRNKWMNQQILRTSNFSKLEYELKKHLRIRLDGLTIQQVVEMENEVMPKAEETINKIKTIDDNMPTISTDAENPQPQFAGKRADHDSLPDEIKALYEKNGEIYFKLKQTFETLKQMHDAQPCDRYELLKVLSELDTQYRKNWQRYDEFVPGAKATPKKRSKKTK